MGPFSTWHLIIVLVIVLIIFGPDKLPQLAKAIGKSVHELKEGMSGVGQEMQQAMKDPPKSEPVPPAPAQTIEHQPEEPKNT